MVRLLASVLALSLAACAASGDEEEPTEISEEAVVTTAVTDVKNQNQIGSCWIYTTVGWVESLVENATGDEARYSETYLIYWDWLEKITSGAAANGSWFGEGGSWGRGIELVRKYGLMKDGDLGLTSENVWPRQEAARKAMRKELASGSLRTAEARRNPLLVRAALDRAFGFEGPVRAHLNDVFGPTVAKRMDTTHAAARPAAKLPIWRASDVPVRIRTGEGRVTRATLADAIGQPTGDIQKRSGSLAFSWAEPPRGAGAQRAYLRRVQRALGGGVALPIVWAVPVDRMGSKLIGPGQKGRYGWHATLLTDYEAFDVPGFGTLRAGRPASAAAQAAALSDAAKVRFLRIKNSWGSSFVPNGWWPPSGYYDLYVSYLTSEVTACNGKDAAHLDEGSCDEMLPLMGVALPPGF